MTVRLVAFRADGDARIGAGHVMRCLSLARELAGRGASSVFVMRAPDDALACVVTQAGFRVIRLDAAVSDCPVFDAAATVAALAGDVMIDWLVIDHYGLDARWHDACRGLARRLMAIDDLADRPLDVDLLLDQNPRDDAPARYAAHASGRSQGARLFGAAFALLRPEFARLRARSTVRTRLNRLFVAFGGADPDGWTERALASIAAEPALDAIEIDVVLGPATPLSPRLEALAGRRGARLVHGSNRIAEQMLEADIAIGASGSMSWERACLGLPSVLIALELNQEPVGTALATTGAGVYLGRAAEVAPATIAAAVKELGLDPTALAAASRAASALVDGRGAARVADAMLARAACALDDATGDA